MRTASAILFVVIISWLVASNIPNSSAAADLETVDVYVHHDDVIRDQDLRAFFSFNLNHYRFERDLMDADNKVAPGPVDHLGAINDNFLRYPGGLVANNFWWEATLGPLAERAPQVSAKHAESAAVGFGVDEYVGLLQATGSRQWYVLNLSGWSEKEVGVELNSDEMAASNGRLARHMKETYPQSGPRYYQLGNELDRAEFQWSPEKYVQRADASMQAILAEDPDARFVAFLRDFDWKYKGKHPDKGSSSTSDDLTQGVLDGLSSVNDYSLHFYYDDPGMNKRFKRVGTRLKQMQKAIDFATSVRDGVSPDVWITEHARGINLSKGGGMKRADVTSNLSAAISSADFLIGISQMPEIKGAFWHGVNAGPWQLFDATIQHKDLRPRPVYWGFRVLRSVLFEQTLRTETSKQTDAQYADDYDVRTSAFQTADGSSLGLWTANRRDEAVTIRLHYEPFAGKTAELTKFELHSEDGIDAEDPDQDPVVNLSPTGREIEFDATGTAILRLMPYSVSALSLSVQ